MSHPSDAGDTSSEGPKKNNINLTHSWEMASEKPAFRAGEASVLLTFAHALCLGLCAGPRQTGRTPGESRKEDWLLSANIWSLALKKSGPGVWLQTAEERAEGRNARFLFHIFL